LVVCVEPFSGVFHRNKKTLRVKVLSNIPYYSGLSYRVVARVSGGLASFTYESVHKWFRRLREALPKPTRRCRRTVAVDETKLNLKGEQLFIWAAVDVKTKEVLACRVSWTKSSMQAETFSERFWNRALTNL